MPELGQKHECFRCGTKFYDLRKNPVLCPKCGADQKEAPPQPTSPVMLAAARRAKRDEFADPDLFERPRDEEEPGIEAEDASLKRIDDEEELPLEGSGQLESPEKDDEDGF